jgi:hypothetical protein
MNRMNEYNMPYFMFNKDPGNSYERATSIISNNNKQLYEIDKKLESQNNSQDDEDLKIKKWVNLSETEKKVQNDLCALKKERSFIMDTDHNEEFQNIVKNDYIDIIIKFFIIFLLILILVTV